jgi:ferredoxin-thioredoxin reductase catalytic subunit
MAYTIEDLSDLVLVKRDGEEPTLIRCPCNWSDELIKYTFNYCNLNCKYFKKKINEDEIIYHCGSAIIGRGIKDET